MFTPHVLGLLALIGLFVQAFVAWVFVALLVGFGRQDEPQPAYRSFRRAFVALSISLTIMSLRFFVVQSMERRDPLWSDGSWLVTLHYAPYMGLKLAFGVLLIIGSYQLNSQALPSWVRPAGLTAIVAATLSPLLVPEINGLLVVQGPLIFACALLAHRALAQAASPGSGPRLVRIALLGLAMSWLWHAVIVLLDERWSMQVILSLNSYVDLAVQLTLGIGLMISLVEDAHERRRDAETERERMRRELERDDKLRALGTVVSGVAHELNNPLTAITGFADLRLATSPDDEDVRVIAEQAERCRSIVRDLSSLSGRATSARTRTDLEELARRVRRGLAQPLLAEDRRVCIEPMGGLEVVVDAVRIEQVLSNLVINALQASPPGTEVVIAADTSGSSVELTVCDQGPGVPPDLRERLFEPFFTTKAPGQGTGLGLSIVHAIVRDHRGTVEVEDAPHGGACFRVLLPDAAPTTPNTSAPPAAPTEGGALLVIDDDAAVRRVLARQAQRRGWRVTEARSAEEALSSDLDGIRAILCDLRMPGIGGAGFHDRLATEQPDLLERTVFLTGNLASEEALRFADRCERPVLPKPVDYDELFTHLSAAR